MENQELTKAMDALKGACDAYEKKTCLPTARMNPAQKLAHARACSDLYDKKRSAKAAVDAILKSKKT